MLSKPFFFWQGRTLVKVNLEEITCLYTVKNYTRIYLTKERYYMLRATLTNALKKLPPDIFIKISRSMAVSVHFIDQIRRDHLELEGQAVPIAKQFYKSFISNLSIIE